MKSKKTSTRARCRMLGHRISVDADEMLKAVAKKWDEPVAQVLELSIRKLHRQVFKKEQSDV